MIYFGQPVPHACTLGSDSWITHSHFCLITDSAFGVTHNKNLTFEVKHCFHSTKLFKTGPWRHITIGRQFWCSSPFSTTTFGLCLPDFIIQSSMTSRATSVREVVSSCFKWFTRLCHQLGTNRMHLQAKKKILANMCHGVLCLG